MHLVSPSVGVPSYWVEYLAWGSRDAQSCEDHSRLALRCAGTCCSHCCRDESRDSGTAPSPDVTVTFNYSGATGGTSVTTATFTSGTEADADFPHPTKPGESFTGWFSTQSLLNGQRVTIIEEGDAGTLIAGFIPPELAQTLNLVLPTASCAQGGACVLGDIGPGGGLVFLISGGKTYEMARNTWSGALTPDAVAQWCNVSTNVITSDGIGTGAANTVAMDAACTSGAGQSAADYSANGLSDWFLPSKDELNAMYTYQLAMPTPMVATYGFVSFVYWSSSQTSASDANNASYQNFANGDQGDGGKGVNLPRVRPVRSF
jgi:hypothetical protein